MILLLRPLLWMGMLLGLATIAYTQKAPTIVSFPLPRLEIQGGFEAGSVVSFSQDGRQIATAGANLWDTKTGWLIHHFPDRDALTLSPDGTMFVDDDLTLRSSVTGKTLRSLIGHNARVNSAMFSPNGKYLLTASDDETAILWDVATGKLIHRFLGHTSDVKSAAFALNGRRMVTASLDSTARVWDVSTGKLLLKITGHTDAVNSAVFSPDGKTLLTASDDETAGVWNATTGKLIYRTNPNHSPVKSALFSPNGSILVHTYDWMIWRPDKKQLPKILTGYENPDSVAFSPNGQFVAFSYYDGSTAIFDLTTRRMQSVLQVFPTVQPSYVSVAPDGEKIAVAADNGNVYLWDIASGAETHRLTGLSQSMSIQSRSLAFSPDSHSLLTTGDADKDAALRLWDVRTGQIVLRFQAKSTNSRMPFDYANARQIAFSPNGLTAVGLGIYGGVLIYDVASGQIVHRFATLSETINTSGVLFSPDGKFFLTTQSGGAVLRDATQGTVVMHYAGHSGDVYFAAFSPDGKQIVTAGDDETAIVWDRLSGKIRFKLTGHSSFVASAVFSPDGATILTASWDGTACLWDSSNGRLLRTFSISSGHESSFDAAAFFPDGKHIITCSADGSERVWDTASGHTLCILFSFSKGGWLVVAPDGRFDSDNLDDIRWLHWILPDDPLRPLPIEIFMRQYYEPHLLSRLLAGENLPPLPNIATLNRVQPQVEISDIQAHTDDPTLVDVTVSYSGQQAEALQSDGAKKMETSGVYDLRLFRNGQMVGALPEDAAPGAAPADLSGGLVGKTLTHTFTVRLARDGAKSVPFTAYAFNVAKVKSRTASRDYAPPAPLPVVQGRAWALAFGVNAYSDPHWNLRYAAADARAFGTELVPRLEKTGQYSRVTFVPLVSDTGTQDPDTLPATKAALRAALGALAGKAPDAESAPFAAILQKLGVSKAAPEDMVLLAFSCHGDADPQTGEYYLFPADIGPDQSRGLTADLEARSLSSAELTAWMQDVDAGEMAMVIDSCHSAAAAGQAFKPGPMDSPGLGQLAYYKRMRILSASAANAVAKEYADLGHGLLTAALVGDGLVSGGAKPAPGQSTLTVGPWLTFAEGDVPQLDARENGPTVKKRLPGRKATAPVNGEPEAPDAGLQKPSLFDFHRAGAPDAAVSVRAGTAGGPPSPAP